MNATHLQNSAGNYAQSFDLEKYLRAAGGTRPETFDWSDPGPRLDDDALFCVGYMMDIESHTIIYLREMLSTGVAEDASISAFLSCWASRMTRHFPAVHMTWGTNNKLSTLTGYHTLIDKTWHPLLTAMLSRIIKDEGRHFSFYFNQARLRLQPRAARILTSRIVRNFWTPAGSPVRGDADARRICGYLFGDARGPRRLAEHDSMIAGLPGLGWFGAPGAGPFSPSALIAQS